MYAANFVLKCRQAVASIFIRHGRPGSLFPRDALSLITVTALLAACGGGGKSESGNSDMSSVTVAVEPTVVTLRRGDTVQLHATVRDARGNIVQDKPINWRSSDESKVSVTSSGLAEAKTVGIGTVTVSAEGRSAAAQIHVLEQVGNVRAVELNVVSAQLDEGDTLRLEAAARDQHGNIVTGKAVHWRSSDAETVSVTAGGDVTALRTGIVNVYAAVDGIETAASLRVVANYDYELIYDHNDVATAPEIYTLDIRDPAASSIPVFGTGRRSSQPAPSPDGSRVAFVVLGQWNESSWQSMIYVADRDGANATRLTYIGARNDQPAWSPDGSRIAFASQPEGERSDIWVMNSDGSDPTKVTADISHGTMRAPSWSPTLADGSVRIVYSHASYGSSQLWTMRPDGSDKRQITSDVDYYDDRPAWSPDGSTIIFERYGADVPGDLYLVSSTGGTERSLFAANPLALGQFTPRWSPDGRLIAFASKHDGSATFQIWTAWTDGTRLARRTQGAHDHTEPNWIKLP